LCLLRGRLRGLLGVIGGLLAFRALVAHRERNLAQRSPMCVSQIAWASAAGLLAVFDAQSVSLSLRPSVENAKQRGRSRSCCLDERNPPAGHDPHWETQPGIGKAKHGGSGGSRKRIISRSPTSSHFHSNATCMSRGTCSMRDLFLSQNNPIRMFYATSIRPLSKSSVIQVCRKIHSSRA
jgi:hypothetical protein